MTLTPTQRAEVVEAMARAICAASGLDPDSDVAEWPGSGPRPSFAPAWTMFDAEAHDSLDAALPLIERMMREGAKE